MSEVRTRCLKIVLGLGLGLAIGAICRVLAIPSPAPPVLPGALLVLAMTLGYLATDRWFARREALQDIQPRDGSGTTPMGTDTGED